MILPQITQDYNSQLMLAREYANNANFTEFLHISQQIIDENTNNLEAILSIGALLLNFGFVTLAKKSFLYLIERFPHDLRATINLANVAKEMGEHHEANRLYNVVLKHLPENPIIRRNFLVGLQYDSTISDTERFAYAKEWGKWVISLTGGHKSRPASSHKPNEPLKIGYVSADFCQHTVGLFVKDIIQSHDKSKVSIYTYGAGLQKDWVSNEILNNSLFRDISQLDDKASTQIICNDKIDILVDLSGHTAGSRLSLFAYRPAPVLVSWLGYFATTGLEYIDAVLLDEWHAPTAVETQFIEPIIRLPLGRLCYTPVTFAPEVSKSPFLKNGYITFGSFNNTAKYSEDVFKLWAKVLLAVPQSKLILKWRTFNDEVLKESILTAFQKYGVCKNRIELRGPSFHADMLKEYADIDIALDPFPFCGGMTSCEALWMGVPVITLPQSRVVSRQTFAFLSAIGLEEFVAKDFDTYVSIVTDLANDQAKLIDLRQNLRTHMLASPLMDIKGFTNSLEDTLINLYHTIASSNKEIPMNTKTILHVGPGHRLSGAKLPLFFQTQQWKEIRLDIDVANEPDIIGSMLDMAEVQDESVDAIYSSHNIEHVYAYEVPIVLKEFMRVLKPEGFLIITCPDLQTIAALVAEDKLDGIAYQSPAGAITPLDIIYGHGAALAAGHHYMAHKCGFTLKTLTKAITNAGFITSAGKRRLHGFDLWVVATKATMTEDALRDLASKVLPN